MRSTLYFLCFLMIPIINTSSAFAQYGETIGSDRPGMSYAATTVGARVMQYQLGGEFRQVALSDGFGAGFIGGGFEGMARIGILERMEVSFSVNYTSIKREKADRFQDASKSLGFGIGARGNFLKSNGKTPNIGLMVEVMFPDKETKFYTDNISQRFALLIEQPLENRVRFTSNIGLFNADVAAFQYTLNLSVDVSPIVTLFVEHYGQYAQEYGRITIYNKDPEATPYYYARVNGGFAIRPLPDLQIDVLSGFGNWLLSPAPQKDWYVGAGISWRTRFKKREKKEKADS